jgi:hypothetical protein
MTSFEMKMDLNKALYATRKIAALIFLNLRRRPQITNDDRFSRQPTMAKAQSLA